MAQTGACTSLSRAPVNNCANSRSSSGSATFGSAAVRRCFRHRESLTEFPATRSWVKWASVRAVHAATSNVGTKYRSSLRVGAVGHTAVGSRLPTLLLWRTWSRPPSLPISSVCRSFRIDRACTLGKASPTPAFADDIGDAERGEETVQQIGSLPSARVFRTFFMATVAAILWSRLSHPRSAP